MGRREIRGDFALTMNSLPRPASKDIQEIISGAVIETRQILDLRFDKLALDGFPSWMRGCG